MVNGQTSAPNLLTEADLISLMDKHGIGTIALILIEYIIIQCIIFIQFYLTTIRLALFS